MVKNILFVCTGNTCRSVMAEVLLKRLLIEKGRSGFNVSSAGVAASPHYRIFGALKKVLDEEKLDVSSHVSTQLTHGMVDKADLVLVMARMHKEVIVRLAPENKKKVFLLKQYIGEKEDLDVADPIGQPGKVYRASLDEIKQYVEKLLSKLIKKKKRSN